jgi:serine/threonine-protein phosphatase 2A regulatory subunit B'
MSQVAERALFMWNNDHIMSLVAQNSQVIVPLVIPALECNSQNHWNQSVLNLTVNLKKMLSEMDEELFSTCLNNYMEDEEKQESLKQKRKLAWERLESVATFQPVTGNMAVLVSR